MKINWTIISLIVGTISLIAVHLTFRSWKISLPVGLTTFLITLYFNPKTRYFRAFSFVIALIAGLNKFFFQFKGTLFEVDFIVGSNETSNGVTIALIILAGLCLVLDQLEQKQKLKGTLFDFSSKKEINVDIKGDGNEVHINKTDARSNMKTFILGIILIISLIFSVLRWNRDKNIYDLISNKDSVILNYKSENQKVIDYLRRSIKDKERIVGFLDEKVLRMSEQILKLENENERLEYEINNIIQSNKNIDLEKTPSIYKKAYKLFLEGNLEKALIELDEDKLIFEKNLISENRKEAEIYILKAQLLRVGYNYKEASKNYEKAVQVYGNYYTFLEVANYFHYINDYSKAEYYYNKCLENISFRQEKAATLNNLGNLYSDQNDYAKALTSYKEAFNIYKDLASKKPNTYLPKVGMTLINLGIFYQVSTADREQSIQLIDKAITILKPFSKIEYVQNYLESGFNVLKNWNIDLETYLIRKLENIEVNNGE
ncbi:MAG: tetratricopeptide repeat protein [Bacteroidota bacterium]